MLDKSKVTEIASFDEGTQIWCTRTEDSLYLGGQNVHC